MISVLKIVKLITTAKKFLFAFCTFLFVLFVSFAPLNLKALANVEKQNDRLIERISKDYTSKFCNSIAFGLSKESAIRFANKENKLIFKKKKGFDNINKEFMADKIAISVVENCGYPLGLKGEKGINEFKAYYISNK